MRHTQFTLAMLAAGSMLVCPATAQEDDAVVVTATRMPTAARDLPARVETIQRAHIEAQGLATLTAAIGAQAVQAGGAGQQASLFLRGANSKHVLALFDGVRLNDASTPNAQYDFGLDMLGGLDRVEVLRGPASAIYGSDAIGGVVNQLPRRGAEGAFAPFAEAAFGSFETSRALAGAAGTVGGLSYGVSGEWFATEGHDLVPTRMATRTGDPDGAHTATLVASARHDPGPVAYDALLRIRDSRSEFDTFSGGPFFDLRADDPDLENEALQTLWRLGAELAPGAATTLRLSGGQVLSDRVETDGGLQSSSAESERTFADAALRYVSQSLLLTAGLSFERNEIDTEPQFADPLRIQEDQAAAYLVGQFDFSSRAVATGALRIDDYENFGTHTTYALGLVVHLASARLFGSYGTAFKAPSLSERFETSLFNVGNPDLAPEMSSSWEIGADWAPNAAVRAGASYYQTRIEDLIEYDFLASRNVNVGEAEIDGAEAFVEARPASWASVRVSHAWTDARSGLTGAQLARRPEHAWSLGARFAPSERIALTASWTYVGDRTDVTYDDAGQFSNASGRVDAFSLGALSATFDLNEQVQLFARIDNLTNEAYEQPAGFAGPPRGGTIGVRAHY